MKSKVMRDTDKRTPRPIALGQPDPVKSGHTPVPRAEPSFDNLHARIATRAYELYVQRGCHNNSAMEDWLQAEREILSHDEPS